MRRNGLGNALAQLPQLIQLLQGLKAQVEDDLKKEGGQMEE